LTYLDFCEELFDKLTQDISQDYSDSSFFGFTNLIDCNWTKGVGFTLKFKIPTLNNLIFYEHLNESFVYEKLFIPFTDGILNQTGWRKISFFISDVIKRDFLKHLTKDWVFPL
jgi:hypothetical protein